MHALLGQWALWLFIKRIKEKRGENQGDCESTHSTPLFFFIYVILTAYCSLFNLAGSVGRRDAYLPYVCG